MPITDPTQEYFKDGGWSWTGSKWIKGGVPFEYAERLLQRVFANDVEAGFINVESDAVPANEIWVATSMAISNQSRACTNRLLGLIAGGASYYLAGDAGGAKDTYFSWSGIMIATEGDSFMGAIADCVLHDYLRYTVVGYKMRIT